MYYPDADRLRTEDARRFFVEVLKTRLPSDKALSNHDKNSPLRGEFTPENISMLSSNIQHTILLSI
jgi:hypothetical protein